MLRIYNTLTRRKEKFEPMHPKRVNLFVCGQTTYDDAHLGHAKTYVCFDVIARWLKYKGYSVFYVQNITDVNPKIDRRARELDVPPQKLAEKYTRRFLEDMERLKVKQNVNLFPKSSDYLQEMFGIINTLLEKDYAYEVGGDVYFDVSRFETYTELAKQDLEELTKRHRIEPDPKKKSPLDFALWKHKTEDWRWTFDSPWGEGIPGWHTEDVAMTVTIFGPQYDVHGGANELIFPHHTNEIAQAEATTGQSPFVRYWLHSGVFKVGGEKMSKSLRNFITIREVLKRHTPEVIRLFLVSTHYRKPILISGESMEEFRGKIERELNEAENSLKRLNTSLNRFQRLEENKKNEGNLEEMVENVRKEFCDAMDDDFNTPKVISVLHQFANKINKYVNTHQQVHTKAKKNVIKTFRELGGVLGILKEKEEKVPHDTMKKLVELLLDIREELRRTKKYEFADKIRERLRDIGIEIEDTEEGPEFSIQ
ncbi:MAG: cysteine--tRNA ligase [Candidatus Korarchaeota archaeon]|nr:cysteine--tRNA ligase [Candidatus Korarchaeota archaeon]NIU83610.1 cysteine--tRNA ligase [Candidatus Thorarchaeota archaeon]NIW14118.1 cysteine--tRNA ligase [Candidatus Thorarchaeota archaeon]NIW52225.1 cysteine--tRNA ligase [Candidatus Korarchaeota archaeon]